MAETLDFELVSPEKLLVSEKVEMAVVPGTEGDFGALPQHAPMITTVRPGVIDIYRGDKVQKRIFVAGGFAEVTPERCIVLAQEAVPVDDLQADSVATRVRDAEEAVEEAPDAAALAVAEQRLAVARAMKQALDERERQTA